MFFRYPSASRTNIKNSIEKMLVFVLKVNTLTQNQRLNEIVREEPKGVFSPKKGDHNPQSWRQHN